MRLSPAVERRVGRIAEAYFQRTGKTLVVTSGTRDPAQQARAMYDVLAGGGDVLRLYRQTDAAREVQRAYDDGRRASLPRAAILDAMTQVIGAQTNRGVFLSAHLREGAVDVRSRGMSTHEKSAFLASATVDGGARVLVETTPPHFHLELE